MTWTGVKHWYRHLNPAERASVQANAFLALAAIGMVAWLAALAATG